MINFLLSCSLVAGSMFLFGLAMDDFYLRLFFKPIPQLCLLYWLFTQTKSTYRNILAMGLVSCIIADVLLEFRQTYFLQGVIIFLIGHYFLYFCLHKKAKSTQARATTSICCVGSNHLYDHSIWTWKNVCPSSSLYSSNLCDDVESSLP